MFKNAFKAAWPHTIPVMAGYIFLGIAFGLLMRTKGYPAWYPIVMSLVIYSGALEFAAMPLIASVFNPIAGLVMGLSLGIRHLFYGIAMLGKYNDTGKAKPILAFTLTDETFSVNSLIEPPTGIDKTGFYLSVSLLNYFYWNLGTALGALFGDIIPFDLTGIDFALTALFIVMFMGQLEKVVKHE